MATSLEDRPPHIRNRPLRGPGGRRPSDLLHDQHQSTIELPRAAPNRRRRPLRSLTAPNDGSLRFDRIFRGRPLEDAGSSLLDDTVDNSLQIAAALFENPKLAIG